MEPLFHCADRRQIQRCEDIAHHTWGVTSITEPCAFSWFNTRTMKATQKQVSKSRQASAKVVSPAESGRPLSCDCNACDLSFCDCSDMEGATVPATKPAKA